MTPPRILIHRPGSLGDTVVALPCFHLIRRVFPDSELRVLTNTPVTDSAPPLFSVLDGSGLVDGYFEYPVSLRDTRRLWNLAADIRLWRPSIAIYLVPRQHRREVLRDGAFLLACGVRRIVGLPLTRDLIEVRSRPDGLYEREAERLARCLAPLGSADIYKPANWDLNLTSQEQEGAQRVVAESIGRAPYIALCIGTKQSAKDWGLAHWLTLVGRLQEIYRHKMVFIGAAADFTLSDAIARNWPTRCINLCGALPVRQSAALISAAALFIGNDSGPMHLAAATGTPLVAVFSNLARPGVWFPPGEQIRVLYPHGPGETISSISPSAVLEAVESLLPANGYGSARAPRMDCAGSA